MTGVDAHDGCAVLCGSGPSIADHVEEIKELQAAGAKIFAMNGCAKFLHDRGIMPDYQVILDAREETATLVGPAREHLFASQCHPACFAKAPGAKIWHLQIEDIEDLFPDYEDAYVLIGGAASVGNTAMCLSYALGYRDMRCYGYDSSHRGSDSHAFHQKMNDGEPCAWVDFNGKTYLASLTMKMQAEKFQQTAADLIALGCRLEVIGDGLLPDIFNAPADLKNEKAKYDAMWQFDAYRDFSPGEVSAPAFVDLAGITKDDSVIDFGCGTGRGGAKIRELTGAFVTQVDFSPNCRDAGATLPFVEADLAEPMPMLADYGYCTDVMEHIPEQDVSAVIDNIMTCVERAFFQISTTPDSFGAVIGHDLHVCVHNYDWWRGKFCNYRVIYSDAVDGCVRFYISQH